jgi:molybdenum cofactor cytidylyltransferase
LIAARECRLQGWSALVLAAGGSRRFGAQKLLAPLAGKAVIARTVEAVSAAGFDDVVLVTGTDSHAVRSALPDAGCGFVDAENWADGIAASIRTGISALSRDRKGVFVFLGDMPLVPIEMLGDLAEMALANGYAARPEHNNQPGHPVCFLAAAYDDLLDLKGDEGASALLRRHPEKVSYLTTSDSGVTSDVDTPTDLAAVEREWKSRFTSASIDKATSDGDLPNP